MTFTWEYKPRFKLEFGNYPTSQQDKILDFIELFEAHGLGDFTKFPGKITQSWKGLATSDPIYAYAYDNNLWHYHVGLPSYSQSRYGSFKTSDLVLHFQWANWQLTGANKGSHIALVDICHHYTASGKFYLPAQKYLDPGKGAPE